jgi:hypothetical protein
LRLCVCSDPAAVRHTASRACLSATVVRFAISFVCDGVVVLMRYESRRTRSAGSGRTGGVVDKPVTFHAKVKSSGYGAAAPVMRMHQPRINRVPVAKPRKADPLGCATLPEPNHETKETRMLILDWSGRCWRDIRWAARRRWCRSRSTTCATPFTTGRSPGSDSLV